MSEESKPVPSGAVTELLNAWSGGNADSQGPLFNLVYPRLRQIAGSLFRGERLESLLQPTSVGG